MKRILILSGLAILLAANGALAFDGNPFARHKGVRPVVNDTYNEECGACHFPYQPGLLPARSWQRLMDPKAMADHFGDNAELDEGTRRELADFLNRYSADGSWYKRSIKIRRSIGKGEAPLRITEVPYIRRVHHELTDRDVKDNPRVKSLSYCDKCHTQAHRGVYDDDTVRIPR